MLKVIATIFTIALLSGCSTDGIPEKLNGKTLYDSHGCAYIVKKNIGDTIFLDFNSDLSKPECPEKSK